MVLLHVADDVLHELEMRCVRPQAPYEARGVRKNTAVPRRPRMTTQRLMGPEYNHTYTHAAPPAGDVGSVWNDGSDRWKPTLNASSSPEAEAQ